MNDPAAIDSGRRIRASGQAIVEFALVAPVFFLILFGIIEAGRFIVYYETLSNAAREGTRYAIVHGSNSFCPSGPMPPGVAPPLGCYDGSGANVAQRVKDSAFGMLGTSVSVWSCWGDLQPDGTCTASGLGNGREAPVTVRASYTYRTLVPLVPLPSITVNGESTLVINN